MRTQDTTEESSKIPNSHRGEHSHPECFRNPHNVSETKCAAAGLDGAWEGGRVTAEAMLAGFSREEGLGAGEAEQIA